MKILIIDDSITIRNILKEILTASGHVVEQAENGNAGIEHFLQNKPDLILLDVEMPGISGYDTAKKIRELEKTINKTTDTSTINNTNEQTDSQANKAIENWIPIVFLSSHSDDQSLSSGIEAGGDDYLFKPFSETVLLSKLKAMERIYSMKQAIIAQRKIVEQMNQELLEEQIVAKNIYDNIVQYGTIKQQDFIKTYVSSKSVFNGDLSLVARSPSENYYVIMGDFTGHGLSAALGIIPTAELFLKLTIKGFTLEEVLIDLNTKLHNILPSNIFCAASVIEVDMVNGKLAVWNGWSPDVFCVSSDGHLKKSFASTNMPLGALKPEKFNSRLSVIDFNKGDKVFIYSDGFPETLDVNGKMFGVDRMKAIIEDSSKTNVSIFDEIIRQRAEFRGELVQQDDLTLIEITMI